ncbi:MAG TPA: energy-coupling factor transporter ATPase [Thermoanaerobacterales bacterium]|nr:energy-coupling factor transporter ATPase [Thermoanaerobacterales bacterium]
MSNIVEMSNLNHVYMLGTPFETAALKDVNLTIGEGEFLGLIGHTGSGKSTLIQHINGLLKPTSGKIIVKGMDLTEKGTDMRKIREKVGLIFQYPEHQLFEETVFKDVAFGPKNLGLPEDKIEKRVEEALLTVGIDYETTKDRSPFELSGGQMRRVAIAGVLAMHPEILILDEPTAGLDPGGRKEILGQIQGLRKKYRLTIILVSHSMEDIAKLADRIAVMHKGRILFAGTPNEIYTKVDLLREIGLDIPKITELMIKLNNNGKKVRADIFTVEDAEREILRLLRGNANV